MATLEQFDYIFAIGMLFAFLDAWNIGANDVANSFSSSVSSRSLKYWQAMVLAAICEFLGAVLVGSRVSDTIRNKIVNVSIFEDDPAVLMLCMMSALVGSSIWLTIATSIGMPVSTTHSIVGAVIGSSIAAKGAENIIWGWDGVAQIFASWFIAPIVAGLFSAIFFLISKYGVLELASLDKSIRNALILVPIMVFITFAILTMLIVWKGAPSLELNNLSDGAVAGSILGVASVAFLLYLIFVYPYNRRKIVHRDWTLKWYHVIKGPIYWFKSTKSIPPMPSGHELIRDFYKGRRYSVEESSVSSSHEAKIISSITSISQVAQNSDLNIDEMKQSTFQYWRRLLMQGPKKWPILLYLIFTHGITQDVINNQVKSEDSLTGDLKAIHNKSKYYDTRLEYLYSLLQVITASTMSFAHGANDIANATGPLSTIYLVWTTNTIAVKADVPVWILCYTAASLVIGLWTFGYRIMNNLGNKLILQSPSRGFCIEIGAACATVMATQLAIPVSTTQCAVGATVFVGLCNKDLKAVNWRMVSWCYLGWFITLPVAGLIAGIINAIILNAPQLGGHYELTG